MPVIRGAADHDIQDLRPGRRRVVGPRLRAAVVAGFGGLILAGGLMFADQPAPEPEPTWGQEVVVVGEGPDVPPAFPTPAVDPPPWDAGGDQVRSVPLPDPIRPAVVAGPAVDLPECVIDDLSLVNHGWDAWAGHTSTVVTASNTSPDACLLGGWPNVRLEQNGPLSLTIEQVSQSSEGEPVPPDRLVLERGHSASTTLTWDGYRAAADSRTPQRLTMRLGSGPERRTVPLAEPSAPFDVVDGATIELDRWAPARPGGDDAATS